MRARWVITIPEPVPISRQMAPARLSRRQGRKKKRKLRTDGSHIPQQRYGLVLLQHTCSLSPVDVTLRCFFHLHPPPCAIELSAQTLAGISSQRLTHPKEENYPQPARRHAHSPPQRDATCPVSVGIGPRPPYCFGGSPATPRPAATAVAGESECPTCDHFVVSSLNHQAPNPNHDRHTPGTVKTPAATPGGTLSTLWTKPSACGSLVFVLLVCCFSCNHVPPMLPSPLNNITSTLSVYHLNLAA